MLEGIIGGVVGSLLTPKTIIEDRVIETRFIKRENELIGYHKWLEEKRKDEIDADNVRILEIYNQKYYQCPKCGKKIELKFDSIKLPTSFETRFRIIAKCDCQREVSFFDVCSYDFCSNSDEKILKTRREHVEKLLLKMRGEKPSYDKIKEDFLNEKLKKKKKQLEKYYGKI